ncbi:hypothetical protein BT69DRAFT_587676 [Atractiella rhizophila]|nr:hypothetical protein BT69DRAFT_587676 [Atractiella rhizophila]
MYALDEEGGFLQALGGEDKNKKLLEYVRKWRTTCHKPFSVKILNRLEGILEEDQETTSECKMVRKMWYDGSHCAYSRCKNVEDLKQCSRCRISRYCSIDHQKADWKDHKPTCFPVTY